MSLRAAQRTMIFTRKRGKNVRVVTSVQGMKWFAIRVEGVEGRSGTAPMLGSSDDLVTASRLVTAVRDTAHGTGPGVATVGTISSDMASQATIPAGINFIIDIRYSSDHLVDQFVKTPYDTFDHIIEQEDNGTSYKIEHSWGLSESIFHPHRIDAVRKSAIRAVAEDQVMEMKNRTCHDSAWMNRVCPTSMIFVPSRDGISHNPNEYTSPEHCTLGAQFFLTLCSTMMIKSKEDNLSLIFYRSRF